MLLCLSAGVFGQGCPWPPHGGDNDTLPPPNPGNTPIYGVTTSGGQSADPNEIIGPMGYDSIHWVSIHDVLNYTILFENDPEFATANAQKVDVRFRFEDKSQMKGFALGAYGFANMSWEIENSPAAYQNRLDLKNSMFIYVDLTAGVDVVKEQAFWTFNSIDPETGYNPWQVDRGMLPVNDSTHVGEGFLKFRLKPNPNMETGDTISIAANIVFDQNDTIPTNRWCVTIDAGMPTSKVKGRKDSKNENLYHLTLQASDDEGGSGLKRVVLYMANNFGIYEEYAVCPLDTVIDFVTEPGHTYRFFTIAEDNVGNLEPLKELADLEINVNAAPTDIVLSDTVFQDDIIADGFIGELMSVDVETDGTFTYALAEGDGAVHNDLFKISGTQLQVKENFKCADDSVYSVRISTTDEGGMSYSKSFNLSLKHVLERPKPDTLSINICEGDIYEFHGFEFDKTGTYRCSISNDYMCDSVYVLQLAVLPRLESPKVTVEDSHTLVSSAAKGNQWFCDGKPIEGATSQKFTPTEDGMYYVAVSNGSCYSVPSNSFRIQLSDACVLRMELAEGWNWVSSNLSNEGYKQLMNFIKPIESKVERFVGFDTEIIRDPQIGLTGNLVALSPTDGYLLQTNDDVVYEWSGVAYPAESTSVNLEKGWNWIGYVPTCENSLVSALAKLSPNEGDIIKGYEHFATYSDGKWNGTLNKMSPGCGYMYYANSFTSFKYPAQHVFPVISDSEVKVNMMPHETYSWNMKKHAYPYNMTMIANVYAGENIVLPGLFTIGAFVGDECRGIGQYVGDKVFMTIYGDINEKELITFKALETATQEQQTIKEKVEFGNVMLGSMKKPFSLTINGATDISGVASEDYNIYPNPVRHTLYINGDLNRLKSVKVVSPNGAVVAHTDDFTEEGLNVVGIPSGSYIAVLSTDGGTIVKKIIKAN